MRVDKRSSVRGGSGRVRVDTRSVVRGGDGRPDRVDTRSVVRGGDGRSDRVDTRPVVRGGDGRVDTRPVVRGGDGRLNKESERQDKEHCELRSFWWQYADDCALLASVCASHEAASHSFWTHEEWMYNLLLHTSDDHFLKLAADYKKFCMRGVAEGTCGVCGVTGLKNGGNLKLSLKSLRYFILRGDQYDDSKYGKFMRDLRVATNSKNAKDISIAKLRMQTLHTYTHPNGTVYHLFERGVINDAYCRVCSTCNTSVSLSWSVEENENNPLTKITILLYERHHYCMKYTQSH